MRYACSIDAYVLMTNHVHLLKQQRALGNDCPRDGGTQTRTLRLRAAIASSSRTYQTDRQGHSDPVFRLRL